MICLHFSLFSSDDIWRWECRYDTVSSVTRVPRCVKVLADAASKDASGLNTCKLTCGNYSMLFPKPSGTTTLGKDTVVFYPTQVQLSSYQCNGKSCSNIVQWLIQNAFNTFQQTLSITMGAQKPKSSCKKFKKRVSLMCKMEAFSNIVSINLVLKTNEDKLTTSTDESYTLEIKSSSSGVQVNINAENFFGARHAMETVSQLSAYHETAEAMQMVSSAMIVDQPSYHYRGLLLDTSRNYFSVGSIKRLITAMSYSKMNTLHWHITDTHSFPIEIKSVPNMLEYGAYSLTKRYTQNDVRNIVGHARYHGIRVLPEFDEPAHCGEGWQWGEKAGLGKLAVCVNKEPWQKYCVEPPCGQLNPTNDNVYDVLGMIYNEYLEMFDEPDLFHAGGDEVNINCWNTTKEITDWLLKNYGSLSEEKFLDMWGMFLEVSF